MPQLVGDVFDLLAIAFTRQFPAEFGRAECGVSVSGPGGLDGGH